MIIVGSVFALPAGICGGMVLADGDMSVLGLGFVAAVAATLGAGIIWAGCRLAMVNHPAGALFAGVMIVLVIIVLAILGSTDNAMH